MRLSRPAVCLALSAGLAGAALLRADAPVVTVGDVYGGGSVLLAPGDELRVRLAARGEGTAWTVAFADASVLKALPGEGATETGFETLRFRAAAPGTGSLGLVCRKTSPSEPSAQPAGLFRIQVEVKEMMTRRRGLLLEEPDSGSIIYLTQGDALSVRLPANPSTGFTWSVAANAPSVLAPGGDPRFEPPPTPRPGAGGFQTLEFRVAAGGAAFLQLVYRRPSEKDAPPARTWGVFVAAASLR
ncbi:MAG TPA: protease inhibitor I42 family protein [Thermoanaerobaculia bacterium]